MADFRSWTLWTDVSGSRQRVFNGACQLRGGNGWFQRPDGCDEFLHRYEGFALLLADQGKDLTTVLLIFREAATAETAIRENNKVFALSVIAVLSAGRAAGSDSSVTHSLSLLQKIGPEPRFILL